MRTTCASKRTCCTLPPFSLGLALHARTTDLPLQRQQTETHDPDVWQPPARAGPRTSGVAVKARAPVRPQLRRSAVHLVLQPVRHSALLLHCGAVQTLLCPLPAPKP